MHLALLAAAAVTVANTCPLGSEAPEIWANRLIVYNISNGDARTLRIKNHRLSVDVKVVACTDLYFLLSQSDERFAALRSDFYPITRPSGNVSVATAVSGAEANLAIGSSNTQRNTVCTTYQGAQIGGNLTGTCTQIGGNVNVTAAVNGAQTNLAVGSNNKQDNHIGSIGAPQDAQDEDFLPWPPPTPTIRISLQGQREIRAARTFGEVDGIVQHHLAAAGYAAGAYFVAPAGFAFLTPLERLDDQGAPVVGSRRWQRIKDIGLSSYFQHLFLGDEGHYRLLLFIISNEAVKIGSYQATQQDVDRWEHSGKTGLKIYTKSIKVSDQSEIYLYEYEFYADKGRRSDLVQTSANETADLLLRTIGFIP